MTCCPLHAVFFLGFVFDREEEAICSSATSVYLYQHYIPED
jgi:hypothetical protein